MNERKVVSTILVDDDACDVIRVISATTGEEILIDLKSKKAYHPQTTIGMVASINKGNNDDSEIIDRDKMFDELNRPIYISSIKKKKTGYRLITITLFSPEHKTSTLVIRLKPKQAEKLGKILLKFSKYGGLSDMDTEITLSKQKFIELLLRNPKTLIVVVRTLLMSPDYRINTDDVYFLTRYNKQHIRNILSELTKEGFLKRVDKVGNRSIYTCTIPRETLERWIKEFFGLD